MIKIKTEKEYQAALIGIQRLWNATSPKDIRSFLHLSNLVEIYEDLYYPIHPPTAIEAMHFRKEQENVKKIKR